MKKLKFCALSLFIALFFILSLRVFPGFWKKIELIFHDIRAQYFIRNPQTSKIKVKKGKAQYIKREEKIESVHSKIVFVNIDDKSLNQIGKWPWDRDVYIKFIENIEKFNPELVLLDIYFPERSKNDSAFAETLAKYDNIGCVYNFTGQKNLEVSERTKRNIQKWALGTQKNDSLKGIESILPTVDPISRNVFLGHDLLIRDLDDIYRKIPEYVIYDGYLYPSITTILYLKYRGYSVNDLDLNKKEFLARDRLIPVDKRGMRYVDYYITSENRHLFRHISFVDILNKRVKVNLDDKIVFVGVTATGLGSGTRDVVLTPIGEIYGIEYLANAMLNIFENRFINQVPVFWENIIFLFFSGLIGLLNYRLTGFKNLAITITLIVLMFFVSFWLYNLGILINFAKFLFGFFFIYVLLTFYKYILEKKEKHKIRNMFSSYMSENIVSELIRNPNLAKLQGQKRKMSVLFSDIVSFTSFSEEHRPEYVVERLNEYLDSMTQTVIDNGGTLDKFVGDEIVALFGAPIEDSKHANKAVKTALDMKNKLKEMKKKWKNNSEKLFDFGIGINSGEMLVGNIGAEGKKMDYTVIGDNVNLGARVEGLTRYYNVNILITEDTYNRITEFVDNCRFIDIVKVKGKKKPTKIYELRDEPFDEDIRELIINGYEYYCNRNWEKAEDCYKKILDKNKQDPVAKVFLKRIKSFRMKAPDDDWHGIFVLDKK